MRPWFVLCAAFVACGGEEGPQECDDSSCSTICEEQNHPNPWGLSDEERALLKPLLVDVKQGIRAWDDQSIGICRGTNECEQFLGTEALELPEGRYMVRANLAVPEVGEPGQWKVDFSTSCKVGDDGEPQEFTRSYDVRFAGKNRGYQLQPLRTIVSPHPAGPVDCTWTLVAHNLDGDQAWKGRWTLAGR